MTAVRRFTSTAIARTMSLAPPPMPVRLGEDDLAALYVPFSLAHPDTVATMVLRIDAELSLYSETFSGSSNLNCWVW